MRSSVDLPQPDGPTKTTNSLRLIVEIDALDHLAGSRTTCVTRRQFNVRSFLATLDRFDGAQHAFDEVALQQEEDDEGRQRGEHGRRP